MEGNHELVDEGSDDAADVGQNPWDPEEGVVGREGARAPAAHQRQQAAEKESSCMLPLPSG